MRMLKSMLAIGVCLAATPVRADDLDDYLRDEMSRRRIPGIAIAVLKDGDLVTTRVHGYANLETRAPVTTASVFELASLTKPFTATAVMSLIEDGAIGLDDPLSRFLDDAPENWAAIRVRHLLSHTSGLAEEAIGLCDGLPLLEVPADYLEGLLRETPLLYPPGSGSSYSDPGYFLLGRVVERASGVSYAGYLERRIFGPLGMEASHVQDLSRIVDGRVAPYSIRDGELRRGRRDWQLELNPQFGIWSSLGDLVRWEGALAAAAVLEASTLERMWTPAVTDTGELARVWGVPYGFGWMVGDFNGEWLVEHGGFAGTHMVRFPDRGWTVIVLTNLDLASGTDARRLSRGVVGFFDPELALPWRLEPADDPDPELTEELGEAFRSIGNGQRTARVTDRWWNEIATLPPPVRDRVNARYSAVAQLRFVTCSPASPRVRESEGAVRVCHYESPEPAGRRFYSLSLDDEDRVLAAPSWLQ